MTRALAVAAAVAAAMALVARGHAPAAAVGPLAVLSTHVAYEASLLDASLPRLPPAQVPEARAVRDATAAQAARLSTLLATRGYPPAKAEALWARLIGNGAPPPSRVLLYVCSVHAQSDAALLAGTPPADLGTTLSALELTLLVEGQQLSRRLGGALGAQSATDQRQALNLLAPLLIPSDRAYATSA